MDSSAPLLIGAGVIAVVSIPLTLKIVPPNPIYGFRTPTTLSNPTLWYRANAFAGWALLLASVASIVLVIGALSGVLPEMASGVGALLLPLAIALAACFVYLRRISSNVAGETAELGR